jgi:hypothetical protein
VCASLEIEIYIRVGWTIGAHIGISFKGNRCCDINIIVIYYLYKVETCGWKLIAVMSHIIDKDWTTRLFALLGWDFVTIIYKVNHPLVTDKPFF